MSKITMFTMGTRGDIQPYIFLSKELIKHGHTVTLCSHPCWKQLIEDSGIEFKPIGPDIDIEKETAIIRGKSSNAWLSMIRTMNFVFKMILNSTDEVYEICKGNDLIIVSHSQIGLVEAEVIGIPIVNVTLQKEMLGEPLKHKSFFENIIGNVIGKQIAKPYNKIRRKYNLKPVKSLDEMMSKDLNLVPISEYVLKKNPYWRDNIVLTGYWYDEEKEFVPDKKLTDFIQSGEKPIILSLGAMSFEEDGDREKLDTFVNAFMKTGCRAIIQGFQKTLKEYNLPESMIACGNIPHSWLFKQGKFVIHHAGFGTAAASLIYGIPSITIPHILDQLGFAMQLSDIKVATKPIMAKDLSEQALINAIQEMNFTYDEKKANVRLFSKKIKNEDGVAVAANLINKIVNKRQ